jgi:hypothetical protein
MMRFRFWYFDAALLGGMGYPAIFVPP